MLRPTPGELLAGVRRELQEQVLPHLPEGEPARQLRAALHVLGRLERSWDLQPGYLVEDNRDLRAAVAELAGRLGTTRGDQPPADTIDIPGVGDPALRDLVAENAHLQATLDRLQQQLRTHRAGDTASDAALLAVHTRMAERAARAAAVMDTT